MPYVIYSGNHLIVYDLMTNSDVEKQMFFWKLFGMSTVSGLIITMFTMVVVGEGGPLAINITGNIRDVGLTYIGFILFDDIKPTDMVLLGLAVSFTGSLIFTVNKV
jgi:hypothetical protein